MTTRTLPWKRWSDGIKEFLATLTGSARRHVTAIFCAHDFAPSAFERSLLPLLWRPGCRARTLVLCDRKALIRNLGGVDGTKRLGAYELASVHCVKGGVFHPKCFLVSAGREHLVGIGSGNLTDGGMGGNLELFYLTERQEVVHGVAAFLRDLAESTNLVFRDSAKAFLREVVERIGPLNTRRSPVLHSLHQPLFRQMWQQAGKSATKVTVLSPWHAGAGDREPRVITTMRDIIGRSTGLSVYTQSIHCGREVGPECGPSVGVWVLKETPDKQPPAATDSDTEKQADVLDLGEDRPNQLHAKAYHFHASVRNQSLFIGSANCTTPALITPVGKEGNVELLVQVPGDEAKRLASDLDRFFDKAKGCEDVKSSRQEAVPPAHILDGAMLPGGSLRLQATDPRDNTTVHLVSLDRTARLACSPIPVRLRRGVARLTKKACTKLLPAIQAGAGTDDRRGFFLGEVVAGKPVPFPVTWAHRPQWEPDDQQGAPTLIDSLEDLLASVSGWRSHCPGWQAAAIERERAEDDDEDQRSWLTESRHAGELDQIAILIARLKRAIVQRGGQGTSLAVQVRSLVERCCRSEDAQLRSFFIRHLKKKSR